MTTPTGDLDALIQAAKHNPPAPPAGAAEHGWSRLRSSVGAAVVLPQIDVPPGLVESAVAGKVGAATTVVGWGWVGKAIASAVVTVTVGGIGVASSGIGERGASPVSQGVATPATSPSDDEAAPRVAMPVAEPIAAPAELPPPAPEPIVAVAIAEPAAIAKRKPDAPKPDEAPMIAAALRSLNAGDAAAALRELARHAKLHPRGDMREERDALRVIALCEAGRTADAASARKKFLDEYPSSPHASRVQASCST
jgi:hypothetical protein